MIVGDVGIQLGKNNNRRISEKRRKTILIPGHQSQSIAQARIQPIVFADGPYPPLDTQSPRPLVVAVHECPEKITLEIKADKPIVGNIQVWICQVRAPHSQIKSTWFCSSPKYRKDFQRCIRQSPRIPGRMRSTRINRHLGSKNWNFTKSFHRNGSSPASNKNSPPVLELDLKRTMIALKNKRIRHLTMSRSAISRNAFGLRFTDKSKYRRGRDAK
jgi:hypothetical protein